MTEWWVDESADARDIRRSVMVDTGFVERGDDAATAPPGPGTGPAIAVRLNDLSVRNNRKWFDLFSGADIRVDVVAVQGNVLEADPTSCYTPQTFRFPGVRDGDVLPTDQLLVYYGWPRHFLDLSIIVSRDRSDSDNLADLLTQKTGTPEFTRAIGGMIGLAVAAPQVAAVMAGVAAARVIGDLAYQVVRAVSGTSIGLYRGSKLAPEFGLGRQPATGTFDPQHLSFWYQVEHVPAEDAQPTPVP